MVGYSARPRDVMRDLVTLLRGHGLRRVYWSACAVVAVVSVAAGVTVWTDGRVLRCLIGGDTRQWPTWDTTGAAADLAALARSAGPAAPPTP